MLQERNPETVYPSDFFNLLPPEVLIQIFHHLLLSGGWEDDYYRTSDRLRRVCSHWRNVLDEVPLLCGHMLVRTQNNPNLCLRHQQIVFRLPRSLAEQAESTPDLPQPGLHRLPLTDADKRGEWADDQNGIQFIPQYSPSLHQVSPHDILVDWSSALLKELQVLHLRFRNTYSPTLPQILQILRQCPDLESLELSDISSPEASVGHEPPVPLSKLIKLRLRGLYNMNPGAILGCLRAPACTMATLDIDATSGPLMTPNILHIAIPGVIKLLESESLVTLEGRSTYNLKRKHWDRSKLGIAFTASGKINRYLEIRFRNPKRSFGRIMSWLHDLTNGPLPKLAGLGLRHRVSLLPEYRPQDLDSLFHATTSLNLRDIPKPDIDLFLTHLGTPCTRDGVEAYPFPRLTKLSFRCCNYSRKKLVHVLARRYGYFSSKTHPISIPAALEMLYIRDMRELPSFLTILKLKLILGRGVVDVDRG